MVRDGDCWMVMRVVFCAAIIYTFNLTPTTALVEKCAAANVQLRSFNVIYHLINDIQREIGSKLPMLSTEIVSGV
jgi:translation initiation factor IF-2